MNKTEDLIAEEADLKNKRIEKFRKELDEESKAAIMNDVASDLGNLKGSVLNINLDKLSVDDCLEFSKSVKNLSDFFEEIRLRPLARVENAISMDDMPTDEEYDKGLELFLERFDFHMALRGTPVPQSILDIDFKNSDPDKFKGNH